MSNCRGCSSQALARVLDLGRVPAQVMSEVDEALRLHLQL